MSEHDKAIEEAVRAFEREYHHRSGHTPTALRLAIAAYLRARAEVTIKRRSWYLADEATEVTRALRPQS